LRRANSVRGELANTRDELSAERERAGDLEHQLRDAQRRLSDAQTTARLLAGKETKARSGNSEDALAALWSLLRIRQEWANRQTATLGAGEEHPADRWGANRLADVLGEEVARIREDTGTPGTLRLDLGSEPNAADSVLLVLSIQTLLDALSRHCQGYDLYVHEWERRIAAVVVCEGFDGPDRVATDASAVLTAIAPAGGDMALDRDSQGRLRARLSLAVTRA